MNVSISHKSTQGLTLLELLVTLSIAAILAAITVPSFQNTIESSRLNSLNDALITFLRGARTEAISRSATITLCPSSDQTTCSGTWSDGWIMFLDENGDRSIDADSDKLIKAFATNLSDYKVTLISDETSSFQFNSEGSANLKGTYQICTPDKLHSDAIGVVIQQSGSLRYAIDSDDDGIKENHAGDKFSC